MNYTQKYHLPQWDETDRILRTDFNQMCANIENGLSQNASGATQANDKTAADAAAAVQAAEAKAFDQACRLAYNHYCFAQTLSPFPRQLGVFHLDTSLSDAGLSGLVKYNDYYQMNYATSKTPSQVLGLMEQTYLRVSNSSEGQALTATFTAPCNGLIQDFDLYFHFYDLSSGITVFPCILTYTDLTNNQTLLTQNFSANLRGPESVLTHTIEEPLLISCSHKYQITVTPNLRTGISGTVNCQISNLRFTGAATGATGSAAYTFQNPPENLGLVAVASYQSTADGDTPRLLAGGQAVPLWWSRTVDDGKGNNIREVVFRRNGAVKSGETMQLQLSCSFNQTLTLYRWGVTLI